MNSSTSNPNSQNPNATGAARKVSSEPTPNPATLKFHLHQKITEVGFDCPSLDESDRSPLAQKLFGFPWTSSVFIGTDFITVTKQDWVEWSVLAEPLCDLISEHLNNQEPVVIQIDLSGSKANENDSPVVKKIKAILDQQIRPVVAMDGGDIVFANYENNILYVKMQGACSGCPSSMMTLKEGVEVRMKELIPEILEVVAL